MTSGIGAAAAQRFVIEGASVCLVDLDVAGCERVAQRIRGEGHQAVTLHVNVSSAEDNVRMIEATIAAFGKIDVAFLNAGYRGGVGGLDLLDRNASIA